ncbi:MAG: hypothetical protein ACLGHN_14195 [Bacteriovoracia bacterium]
MKLLLIILLIHASLAFSGEDCNCRSQLMRLEVEGSTIQGLLTSRNSLTDRAEPTLENFLKSDLFKSKVVKDYPMPTMGFPFQKDVCEREKKEGDSKFKNIDCQNPNLCSDPSVSEAVKAEICVSLPCSIILGSQNMHKCPPMSVARPSHLHFPEPIGLKKLEMEPVTISTENDIVRACFNINEMEISFGIGIEFNKDPQVDFESMGIENLNFNLDEKREICLSGKLKIGSTEPLTDIKIERMNGNFISDSMINRALSGSRINGLSGYSPATLNVLKLTAAPALARHFRPALEEAVTKSLAISFETQITEFVTQSGKTQNPIEIQTPANSFISEMGVANLAVMKYADLLECSLLKNERQVISPDHPCLTQLYPFRDKPLRVRDIPSPKDVAKLLREQLSRYNQVTSEKFRNQLLSLEGRMQKAPLDKILKEQIEPLTDKIGENQLNSTLMNAVQLMSKLGDENSMTGLGLSIPDICDVLNPSAHAGRSIPNCPVQAYVDTEELNRLMTSMFNSGRLCHNGKGDFVPERKSNGAINRNRDGSARGSGCLLMIEEDEDGLRCYLNGAPQLRYDSATGKYKVDVKTKECFRGGVALGLGKIRGDINFEVGFNPTICENGDFCLEDGEAEWNVVPGTAEYALREKSWFNGKVRRTIDKKLNEVLSKTIRVPTKVNSGPVSMIPLEPDGRIDKGHGFFGACLRPKY